MEPPAASGPARGEAAMRRAITPLLGVFVVVNATIGTGIFKTPAKVARLAGTLPATMAVWVAGGVIALSGALSLAELAAALPRTGGMYEYLRRAYGPRVAFLLGWTKLTLLIPSAVGSFARLAAEALSSLLGLPPDGARDGRMALVFLAGCAAANLLGVRSSTTAQAALTAAKYGGVALLAVLGLAVAPSVLGGAPAAMVPSPGAASSVTVTVTATAAAAAAAVSAAPAFATAATLTGCFTALVSVMWAYDGWADLAALSGEVERPERSLPRALVAGTLAIVVVYLAANAGYARALGLDGLRRSTTGANMAAANVAALALGGGGRRLLSAILLVSCTGGCMSSLLTGSRVFVPLATDGLFVRWLGGVSPRTAVPSRAVVVGAVLGGAYVLLRSFEQLTDAFVVGYFPFYLLAVLAVPLLRRREPDLPRPFRVPLYPLVPLLFVVGAVLLLVGAAADADRTALFAGAVMALGFPVRAVWLRVARPRYSTT